MATDQNNHLTRLILPTLHGCSGSTQLKKVKINKSDVIQCPLSSIDSVPIPKLAQEKRNANLLNSCDIIYPQVITRTIIIGDKCVAIQTSQIPLVSIIISNSWDAVDCTLG